MINLNERKTKEVKSILVRTKKGNTLTCYHFIGVNANTIPPECRQHYASYDKVAERVEITWNVGGDVFIYLYNTHPNGFEVVERVLFDRRWVTNIEIETDFTELRNRIDTKLADL
jgi:hypothetical protein